MVLGVDIGGTNMRFGLVSPDHKILSYQQLHTADTFIGQQPLNKLCECIKSYLEAYVFDEMPDAVSIGMPSTIDRRRTTALQTPNIDHIPDFFRITEPLEGKLGIPVYLNRDVNNLLLYDLYELQIDHAESACGIYFGTGIGNAILLNGRLWNGFDGVGGELGHIPVLGNIEECGCGNKGCLEANIGGRALEKIQRKYFPDVFIGDIFKRKSDTPEIKAFVKGMGQVIAIEENLLNPQYMIIGGGLPIMEGFPKDELEHYAHASTRKPYPEKTMKIYYSHPDQKNGVIGAAIYAEKCLADPTYR